MEQQSSRLRTSCGGNGNNSLMQKCSGFDSHVVKVLTVSLLATDTGSYSLRLKYFPPGREYCVGGKYVQNCEDSIWTEVTRCWRKFHNAEVQNLYSSAITVMVINQEMWYGQDRQHAWDEKCITN
jgi:hypothetical protein